MHTVLHVYGKKKKIQSGQKDLKWKLSFPPTSD